MKTFFAVLVFVGVDVFACVANKQLFFSCRKQVADTVKERNRSSEELRNLVNGAVIVRLKTNQKSVEAYRNSGRAGIADKIETDRRNRNQKLHKAFKTNFHFCRVFFIYANETVEFLNGNRKIFLNENLQHDSTIVFNDTAFVFCEYGTVEQFSNFQDYQMQVPERKSEVLNPTKPQKLFDTVQVETSTSPATTNGLFFSDKNLMQFQRPFPFVEGVYLDNFDAPVRSLNRQLERAYENLVVRRDYNDKVRAERKKRKQEKRLNK
jgi:hypothetical protein